MKAPLPFAFLLLLLSSVVTTTALAQDANGQIDGVVVDSTGQPLAGQRVALRQLGREGLGRVVEATNVEGESRTRDLAPVATSSSGTSGGRLSPRAHRASCRS